MTKAIVDTGANYSLVDIKIVRRLGLHVFPPDRRFWGVEGSSINCIGKVWLPIEVQGHELGALFYCVTGITNDVLLGLDYQQKFDVRVVASQGTISIMGGKITPECVYRNTVAGVILSVRAQYIAPGTCDWVTVKFSEYCNDDSVIVEPFDDVELDDIEGIVCAPQILNTRGAKKVRVANTTDHVICVKRNTPLGHVSRFEECMNIIDNPKPVERDPRDPSLPRPGKLYHGKTWAEMTELEKWEFELEFGGHKRNPKRKAYTCEQIGLKIKNDQLSENDKRMLMNVINEFGDVIAMEDADMEQCPFFEMKIEPKPGVKPYAARPFNQTKEARDEIFRQIQLLLDIGFVKPFTSEWSANCLCVSKKSPDPNVKVMRVVFDYRGLNERTVHQLSNLVTFEEVYQIISEAQPTLFTTLDIRSAFHTIKVAEESQHLLAFSHLGRRLTWNVAPFGTQQSPASCAKLFTHVLGVGANAILSRNCLVYVDDIVLFAKTPQEMAQHLAEVLRRLRVAHIRVSGKKIALAQSEVEYLGAKINAQGIKPLEDKVKALIQLPIPKDQKQLKRLLGAWGWHSKYIVNYAEKVELFRPLLRKDVPFIWTTEMDRALEVLRRDIAKLPQLHWIRPGDRIEVYTDASKESCSYVIYAITPEGETKLIKAGGKSLNPAQRHYNIAEQEMIAIVMACKQARSILKGVSFVLKSDNISLSFLKNLNKSTSGRLQRWAVELQDLSFTIEHIKGQLNPVADALSRVDYSVSGNIPTVTQEEIDCEDETIVNVNTEYIPTKGILKGPLDKRKSRYRVRFQEQTTGQSTRCKSPPPNRIIDMSPNDDVTLWQTTTTDSQQNDEDQLVDTLEGLVNDSDALETEIDKVINEVFNKQRRGETKAKTVDGQINQVTDDETLVLTENTSENFAALQRDCPELSPIVKYLVSGELPDDEKLARKYVFMAHKYHLSDDGILCFREHRVGRASSIQPMRVLFVVPVCLRQKLLHTFHNVSLGHLGVDKTFTTITKRFYWETLFLDVKNYVRFCVTCQINKSNGLNKPELHPLGMPTAKFSGRLIIDVHKGFPTSEQGNTCVLVAIDEATNYVFFKPMKDERSITIVEKLLEIFSDLSYPVEILSDRGSNLTSRIANSLCKALGIKRTLSSSYSPATNGRCEKAGGLLAQIVRHVQDGNISNWERLVTVAQTALRAASSKNRPLSPWELVHGFEFRFPVDIESITYFDDKDLDDRDEYVQDLKQRLSLLSKFAKEIATQNDEKTKAIFDQHAHPQKFEVKDLVWVKRQVVPTDQARKLASKFVGPYFVTEVLDSHNVMLMDAISGRKMSTKFHVNKLKRAYIADETRAEMKILPYDQPKQTVIVDRDSQVNSPCDS